MKSSVITAIGIILALLFVFFPWLIFLVEAFLWFFSINAGIIEWNGERQLFAVLWPVLWASAIVMIKGP